MGANCFASDGAIASRIGAHVQGPSHSRGMKLPRVACVIRLLHSGAHSSVIGDHQESRCELWKRRR
eukprot:836612-Alexandrium_andersonii.AAC.1